MSHIKVGRFSHHMFKFLGILFIFYCLPNWTTGDRVRLSKLRYEYDHKFYNLTAVLDSKAALNIDYHLLKRRNSLYMHYISYSDTNKKSKIITEKTLDVCKVCKLNAASPLFLGIIQMIKKFSNETFLCPGEPGYYFIHGLDFKFFPVPSGKLLGFSNNIRIEMTFLRDKAKDEVANSVNGKMLLIKFWVDLTLIR